MDGKCGCCGQRIKPGTEPARWDGKPAHPGCFRLRVKQQREKAQRIREDQLMSEVRESDYIGQRR